MNNKNTLDDFQIGERVNAEPLDDDFNHEFTGGVISKNKNLIQVRDGDGDVFDCEPSQLSHCTDEIMHEN